MAFLDFHSDFFGKHLLLFRFKTQKENERQEKLLLSVLPSFVAQQMIRDIALEEEKAQAQRHLSPNLRNSKDQTRFEVFFFLKKSF
jgi:hypothetical protein